MRLPNTAHTSRPWRIHELTCDFRLEDVWALPTQGGPDDFPRLVQRFASADPSQSSSRAVRTLFAIRWKLGGLLGWDDPDAGLGSRVPTLRDRLPADLRETPGPDFDALPFTSLYLLGDEWAAEIANRTMHGVMHIGWVPDGTGGYRAQMAVLVTRALVCLEYLIRSVNTERMTNSEAPRGMGGPTAAELHYVEDVALGFERQGLFRMAGRVIGWLLICDPPEQTFGQLAEVLQASKGSISAAMKFLIPAGIVERTSRPGERRDYYRCRPGAWAELARDQSRQYDDFRKLAQRGLELLADAPADRRERLQGMHDLYAWLEREMPALWERWRREHQEKETRGDGNG